MRILQAFVLGALVGGTVTIGVVTATESETDAVTLSPQLYDVRLENDRVRVSEYRLKPGQKEPMHSHHPGIVYVFSNAVVRTTAADGTTAERPGSAGDLYWRDATTHAVENIGETEVHALSVELKPCH